MPNTKFLNLLADRVVICDGGMGTMLYERGVFISRCFEQLNLSDPDLVRAVHEGYVAAGADVIETNTFGANAVKLEQHGFKANLAEINYKGAKIARKAAGPTTLVAGAVGPLAIRIEPWGPTSVDEAKDLFSEQIQALLEGGVDLIILETFSDVNEIWQAIRAARELDPSIAIVAQMSLGEDGDSLYGTPPEVFAQRLDKWGADVIGVNCSVGPAIMLDSLERMRQVVSKPLSAMPNAGLPRKVDGRNMYLASPEYMASYVKRFVAAGARLVGGCCGTTPAHIRAMHQAIRMSTSPPSLARGRATVTATDQRPRVEPVPLADKSRLARALAAGPFVTVAEVTPPRGLDSAPAIAGVRTLKEHGCEFVIVSEPARTSARMTCDALALLLEREVGVEAVLHLSSRDRELLDVQSALLGSYALGLRNVLCERGDAPTLAEKPASRPGVDLDSIGVTNMVRRLNEGYDLGEGAIGAPTGWHLGVVINPTAVDLESEIHRFEWKVDAGAEFCVTRPVFGIEALENLLKRIAHVRIPVLVGIRPLVSFSRAEYLSNEVPGTRIPATTMARMEAVQGSERDSLAEGVKLAQELLTAVRGLVEGVVIASPMGHYDAVAQLLDGLGDQVK